MREALLAPVEEPGLWTPPGPGTEIVRREGFCLVVGRRRGTVERVRLAPGGVGGALAEVRALARARDITEVVWWVGELSRPDRLAERLRAAGLVPVVEEPHLAVLTIDRAPPRPPGIPVREVADLDAYRAALELDWDAWGVPEAERAERRPLLAAGWGALVADGRVVHHVAHLDGRPAGFSRLVGGPAAGALMGGAVLPWARGRGVYRALVHARWSASLARGTPRLVTAAGAMSTPILERLGFARIGTVTLLRDPGVAAG